VVPFRDVVCVVRGRGRETKTPPGGRRRRTRKPRALANDDDRGEGGVHRPSVNRFGRRASTRGGLLVDCLWIGCGIPVGRPGPSCGSIEIPVDNPVDEERPLDLVFHINQSVRTDTFDGVVHRRVGGGPDYLTRDTATSGSGRGTPRGPRRRRLRPENGTRPPGATPTGEQVSAGKVTTHTRERVDPPTWEPRGERQRRLHHPGLSHVSPPRR
jgi:hypothetical protein